MSRFPAELIVTLTDGSTVSECFNQAEMADFTRRKLLGTLACGQAVVVYGEEPIEIPASRVAAVEVVVRNPVTA